MRDRSPNACPQRPARTTLTSFMKVSMTDPPAPFTLLLSRDTARVLWACLWAAWCPPEGSCGSALCPASSLRAQAESPVSLIPPKARRRALLRTGAQQGLSRALPVMFLPERWTPRPSKLQLMLHKMLVGYQKQTCFGQRPLTLLYE